MTSPRDLGLERLGHGRRPAHLGEVAKVALAQADTSIRQDARVAYQALNDAIGFKNVTAFKSKGSTDSAVLYDTPGNDTFSGQGGSGTMTTPSVSYGVAG